MYRILIVEDDLDISELLQSWLTEAGYQTAEAEDGLKALEVFESGQFDLVLLDLMLPRLDGFGVCEWIRKKSNIPIVMLTALDGEEEQLRGYDLRIDDYITKPFGTSELLARLRTAIRHTRTTSGNASIAKENRFTARGLVIDYDKYRVYIDGRDAGLTQNEFKLVALLGRFAGRVLTYDYLIREIWGPNKAYDNQILRVNMANIRRKIEKNPAEPEYIFTEVGVGYRMIEGD